MICAPLRAKRRPATLPPRKLGTYHGDQGRHSRQHALHHTLLTRSRRSTPPADGRSVHPDPPGALLRTPLSDLHGSPFGTRLPC